MMASNSQHRRVFVGNIPYDATEEQLKQICEEVGPVVNFRLVTDRETGKPKGYGFCEYKDEETALSARRNLQGYEINGRQLRVDFAENDKNADRSHEQGRGGPGMAASIDPQKQFGGQAASGGSSLHQPIGLSVAMAAAAVMTGALGGAQTTSKSNQNGLQIQPVLGTDPLTIHLAKMSRNQLTEVLSEMKVMATQNKEHARQLLLVTPHLSKAVFQAEIMLGMVAPHMLQLPNIRQASGPITQPLLQDSQGQQPAVKNLPGMLPPFQNSMHFRLMPQSQEGQISAGHPNSYAPLSQIPLQSQFQLPQVAQNQILQQGLLSALSGVSTFPSIHPQQLSNLSVRPQMQLGTSTSMKQQAQQPLLQHSGQVGSTNLVRNTQVVASNVSLQPSLLTRPPLPDRGFQPSSSILSGIPNIVNKESDRPHQVTNDPTWARRGDARQSLPFGLPDKASMVPNRPDQIDRPSKMVKLEDGKGHPLLTTNTSVSTSISGSSQAFVASGNQIPKAEEASTSGIQTSQLPPDMESVLLQQVLNLTSEQLSSLPPDQQQQVIQLQQMLRQST